MAFTQSVNSVSGNAQGRTSVTVQAPAGQTIKQCGGFLRRKDTDFPLSDDEIVTVGGFLGSYCEPTASPLGNQVTLLFTVPQFAQLDLVYWYET